MITIDDVAKRAGVSTMTVSRVINNSDRVKGATKEKVLSAIDELGYIPNMIAKTLAGGKSKTIGILFSNYYNQAYLDIIVAIEEEAYRKGYTVINANVNDYESAVNALDLFVGKRVEGIIVLPLEMKMTYLVDYHDAMTDIEKFKEYFKKEINVSNLPVVTVSEKIEGVTDISFDYVASAKISMKYLISCGYRDIAMINNAINDGLWKDKGDIYCEAMREIGAEENILIEYGQNTVEGGYAAAQKLLRHRHPQAIYCANDYMAIGVMQALNSKGISVPKDIAVMGNDDIAFAKMTAPKMTTVAINTQAEPQIFSFTTLNRIRAFSPTKKSAWNSLCAKRHNQKSYKKLL